MLKDYFISNFIIIKFLKLKINFSIQRLSNKPSEALKYYNKCRGDKKYGRSASIEMANLCLNPENEIRSDEDWRKKNPK